MFRRSLVIGLILLIFLAFTITGCGGGDDEATDGEVGEILLGAVFPITGVGSTTGKHEAIGAAIAVEEINAAGGINGIPVRLVMMDTASDPMEAVTAVRRLTSDDKVLAIIGPHYSSEAEVTFPLGNELEIVQIGVATSKPGLSAENRPYGLRNTLTEDKIARAVIGLWIERHDIKTVAIMTDVADAVSKSLGEQVFPAVLQEYDVEILTLAAPVTFMTEDMEFSAQITQLKSLNPDGVALGALGPDALNIIVEARRQGLDAAFVGGAPIMEGEVDVKGYPDTEGTYGGGIYWLEDPLERNQDFVARFAVKAAEMYTGIPTEPWYYAVNAYDAVLMVAEAIEKGGVTLDPAELMQDREKILLYLDAMDDFDGLASRGYDDEGDGIKDVVVLEIIDGRWTLVEKVAWEDVAK